LEYYPDFIFNIISDSAQESALTFPDTDEIHKSVRFALPGDICYLFKTIRRSLEVAAGRYLKARSKDLFRL